MPNSAGGIAAVLLPRNTGPGRGPTTSSRPLTPKNPPPKSPPGGTRPGFAIRPKGRQPPPPLALAALKHGSTLATATRVPRRAAIASPGRTPPPHRLATNATPSPRPPRRGDGDWPWASMRSAVRASARCGSPPGRPCRPRRRSPGWRGRPPPGGLEASTIFRLRFQPLPHFLPRDCPALDPTDLCLRKAGAPTVRLPSGNPPLRTTCATVGCCPDAAPRLPCVPRR
jgi:hypothetical protein